jgi:hypothetical protein
VNFTFLIITSIAKQDNPILQQFASESIAHCAKFIVIGDAKSPAGFNMEGCDFYSVDRQLAQNWTLGERLPLNHYARKNLGYLEAMSKGAEIIIETDDDNIPLSNFWEIRKKEIYTNVLLNKGWVNVYKYFTDRHIWPRGFALEHILDNVPLLEDKRYIHCPIQQGLADENPDVDAIYRLTLPLQVIFNKKENVALGINSVCPFNSQNTTWFKEAFPLLYLPSYCSFRMTDIWRSFIAQRIAWTCGWSILFYSSTVKQKRNDHNLMLDFQDEISGYTNNLRIINNLKELVLKNGINHIPENMLKCYNKFISMGLINKNEIPLLKAWLKDIKTLT